MSEKINTDPYEVMDNLKKKFEREGDIGFCDGYILRRRFEMNKMMYEVFGENEEEVLLWARVEVPLGGETSVTNVENTSLPKREGYTAVLYDKIRTDLRSVNARLVPSKTAMSWKMRDYWKEYDPEALAKRDAEITELSPNWVENEEAGRNAEEERD